MGMMRSDELLEFFEDAGEGEVVLDALTILVAQGLHDGSEWHRLLGPSVPPIVMPRGMKREPGLYLMPYAVPRGSPFEARIQSARPSWLGGAQG